MADLALLCHWTPQDMHPMDVDELLDWHARIVERHNRINGAE